MVVVYLHASSTSKMAFDYVNYWKLFTKLLQDNIDSNVVCMLAYWYNNNTVISIALFTDRPGALTTSDVCFTK